MNKTLNKAREKERKKKERRRNKRETEREIDSNGDQVKTGQTGPRREILNDKSSTPRFESIRVKWQSSSFFFRGLIH